MNQMKIRRMIPDLKAPRRSGVLLFLTVFGSGAALRLFNLGEMGLWLDEAYTARIVQNSFGGILEALQQDDARPIYYLLEKIVVTLAGGSEFGLRLLSALAGMAAIVVAWKIGRRHLPRAAGLMAVLIAFSDLSVFYAQQARSYNLLILGSLFLLMISLELRVRPTFKQAAAFCLTALALIYTHNLGILLWPPALLMVADVLIQQKYRRMGAMVAGILFAGLAPWLIHLTGQLHLHGSINQWMGYWWSEEKNLLLGPVYSCLLFVQGHIGWHKPPIPVPGLTGGGRFLGWMMMGVAGAGVAAALCLLRPGRKRHGSEETVCSSQARSLVTGCMLFTLLPLVGLMVLSYVFEPIYVLGRHDVLALPGFLLLIAAGWSRIGSRRTMILFGVLWTGIGLLSLYASAKPDSATWKGNDRQLAVRMGRDIQPGDAVVAGPLAGLSLHYYGRRQGWMQRVGWFGYYPLELFQNEAALTPLPVGAGARFLRQARTLRGFWDRERIQTIWILAVKKPDPGGTASDSSGRSSPGEKSLTANDLLYPTSLLVASMVGLRQLDVAWEYRQDWVSGNRVVLRIGADERIPLDRIPEIKIRPVE